MIAAAGVVTTFAVLDRVGERANGVADDDAHSLHTRTVTLDLSSKPPRSLACLHSAAPPGSKLWGVTAGCGVGPCQQRAAAGQSRSMLAMLT